MRKLGKKLVAVAGVIAMLMIILVYGFAETRIPGIVYLAMWCVRSSNQRAYFQTGDTKDVEFRIRQLKKLYQWITVHEQEIMDALYMDLNKSNFEAYATEIGIVKEEIRYTLKHLRKWAAPKRVPTPITQFPSKSFIYPEPYGIVLIMSPWNYPFELTIPQLVGAICQGNCAVVKHSTY